MTITTQKSQLIITSFRKGKHTHSCTTKAHDNSASFRKRRGRSRVSTHVNRIPNQLQRPECNNLFEEIKGSITSICVREVGDRGRARPGDDGSQEDANENGTPHAIQHQEHREHPSRPHRYSIVIFSKQIDSPSHKHTKPHGWILEDMPRAIIG